MKVLLLNQIPEVNNKYTFSLAEALIKQGIDIIVCGIEDDNVKEYHTPYINYFYSYSKEKGLIKKVKSYNRSWKRVFNYCVENKVDIVHVQWYIFSPLDYYYHKRLRKHGIKVVTTIHDLLPFNKKFYDFHFHKKIYSHANHVITQAKMNIDTLVKDFGVFKDNISYIPHGHYMEYAQKATLEESRQYLNIPMDKKVILFFGQIKKVKGVDVLIKALPDVIKKHPDTVCIIAGKVWKDEFQIYDDMINELGLKEHVIKHIRFIDDSEIKYFFNASDIVALPYRQIYQSGVVLLAYAYEKPVVATTEGEFLSVIKDKETGLLVEAGNHVQYAKAINWYLDNPEKINEFGRAGHDDLMVRLSWETIGKDICEVYRLIKGKK
ncbi:MAG: glycosyltransferase family 4 protein [Lachnospiraceae bacterium]